jgi:thiamine pyrophosphokinase
VATTINTTTGAIINPGCDAQSPTPAYIQRAPFTTQTNSTVLGTRQQFYPRLEGSLFKVFQIREATTFEIRGEFYNILNTPIFSGTGTTIGNGSWGIVPLTQVNDPRYGQLTARLNF